MATLPSLTKTYEYAVNVQIPAQGTHLAACQRIWRQFVTTLLGFVNFPFTIDYSCDSVAAGTKGDGVNRWSADNKLVWTASAAGTGIHSWIVLSSSGPMPGFQLCISCERYASGQAYTQITIVMSYGAGFTGGTTSLRPTATDEAIWCNGTINDPLETWCGYNYSATTVTPASVLSAWHSTDGQITTLILMIANVPQFIFVMSRVNPQISTWATPGVGGFASGHGAGVGVNGITYANLVRATKMASRLNNTDIVKFLLYMTVESFNASTVGEQQTFADDNSTEWPILPVGLFSPTATHRGRKGLMIDFWLGSTGVNNGDTYPDDATKQFVQFGVVILPWNGTTPVTA